MRHGLLILHLRVFCAKLTETFEIIVLKLSPGLNRVKTKVTNKNLACLGRIITHKFLYYLYYFLGKRESEVGRKLGGRN